MAYLNWNDKTKSKEDDLVIISIKLSYIILISTFYLAVGLKLIFLMYQMH